MKTKYGVSNFFVELDILGSGKGLINSAVCGNCGSQNVVLSSGDDVGYMEIKIRKTD